MMYHPIFDGFSVVSLEGTGLTVQQLLDSSLIQNTVTIEDHNVTSSDSAEDPLNSNFASISVIDEGLTFDDDDMFQCGKCKMQFSSLDAFMLHKRNQCSLLKGKKERNSSPIHSTSAIDCESETSLGQVTSSVSIKEEVKVEESQQTCEKFDCALTSTVPENAAVGEYFNLALDSSQVFTLNENLEITASESDKIIESKNGPLFAATSTLVAESDSQIPNSTSMSGIVAEEEVLDSCSQKAKDGNSEESNVVSTLSPLPDNPSNYTSSLFHGRMAKTLPNKESGKVKLKHHCSFCSKVFSKNFDLQQHIRSHTGEKPFQCVVCGRGFAQKSNVKKHMITHKVWPRGSVSNTLPKEPIKKVSVSQSGQDETSDESKTIEVFVDNSYVCPFCSKVYASYMTLRSHMKHHKDQKVYRCMQKECFETFDELDTFLDHVKVHEVGKELQYWCHTCSKVFTSLRSLGHHQFEHSIYPWSKKPGPSYFRCTKCMNKYASAEALDHHLKITNHHFPCKQCSRVFYSERLLRTHLKVHGNINTYICTTCSKEFKSEHSLKMHQLIHTGEKPFECQLCSLAFNRKDKLKRHLLVHEAKKFKCPFRAKLGCLREFRRNDKLRLHLMSHVHNRTKKCSNQSQTSKGGRRSKSEDATSNAKLKTEDTTSEEPDGEEHQEDSNSDIQHSIITRRSFKVRRKRGMSRGIADKDDDVVDDITEISGIRVRRYRRKNSTLNKKSITSDMPPAESESKNISSVQNGVSPTEEFIISYPLDHCDEQGNAEEEIEVIYVPFSLSENDLLGDKTGELKQDLVETPHTTIVADPPTSLLMDDASPSPTITTHSVPSSGDDDGSSLVEPSQSFFLGREEAPFISSTQLGTMEASDVLLTQPNLQKTSTSPKNIPTHPNITLLKANPTQNPVSFVKVDCDSPDDVSTNVTVITSNSVKDSHGSLVSRGSACRNSKSNCSSDSNFIKLKGSLLPSAPQIHSKKEEPLISCQSNTRTIILKRKVTNDLNLTPIFNRDSNR